MTRQIFFFTIIIALAAIGCRTTKKINTVISKKDSAQIVLVDSRADSLRMIDTLMMGVEKNRINYQTFSAKMKMDYWDKDGKGPDLTVFIRMRKDSLIWVSINATVFSYEAFRVLITPDSVKLLNKKDKVVQLRSVNYLQEVAGIPFDFKTLQDLIIGNPIFIDSNIVSYKNEANTISLLSIGGMFKNLITVNKESFLVQHIKLDDVNVTRNRTCNLSYSGYNGVAGFPFATFRKISLAEKSKIDVELEYKQFSFNESLNYPFSVPKNYTVQ
ncbi:DUF4292 domain-containing protein [Flavihumibacter solisilvae]|uniref:DUF4292 domain-containing protein n=1 Tax=Flavihumibacter solisilvae TaxID=1349421 RepID=UPI0009E327CE|nr:DUF4292 domain-containing protein [Flavihumibacter solisilvae]